MGKHMAEKVTSSVMNKVSESQWGDNGCEFCNHEGAMDMVIGWERVKDRHTTGWRSGSRMEIPKDRWFWRKWQWGCVVFSLHRCSCFTLMGDWLLWHNYDCGNVWPPESNEKREGGFFGRVEYWADLTGMQPVANSSTENGWGCGWVYVCGCVCVWDRGSKMRERGSAWFDRIACWVLRVRASLKSCHRRISSQPPKSMMKRRRGGGEEGRSSRHQHLLMLNCTMPQITQWKMASFGTFYSPNQTTVWIWILPSKDYLRNPSEIWLTVFTTFRS